MANLIDVNREFGTEEQCLAYLEAMRWPDGVACLRCGSLKVSKATSTVKSRRTGKVTGTRYVYDCLEPECGHQFSATTGTVFHDTHLPLPKWFLAIAIICDAKKSVSALQIQRHLGLGSYRTAWHLMHRIRKAMESGSGGLLTGTVEVDETHTSGKYDKRRNRKPWQTRVVVGMIERGRDGEPSQVRAFPVKTTSKVLLSGAVRANVAPEAENLYTDESGAYKALGKDYRHATVNHIHLEYVRGDVHTNSIEGFWSLFKLEVRGSWHHISIKHLTRYLGEFSYRFNNRGAADLFGMTVSARVSRIRLPYAELISE